MENTQQDTGRRAAESSFFKKFTRTAEEYLNKPTRLKKLLTDVYQRASEQKELGVIATEVWEGFQKLYRMIKAATSGEYHGIEKKTLVGGIAVLIYLLFPIDLIPDFIPVIGLLDDAALLAWFLTSIKTELDHFSTWEESQPKTEDQTENPESQPSGGQETGTRAASVDNSDQRPKFETQNTPDVDQISTAGKGKLLIEDLTVSGLDTDEGKAEGQKPSPAGAAPTGAGEPSVIANTTDSTRMPNSNASDATSGGNVR